MRLPSTFDGDNVSVDSLPSRTTGNFGAYGQLRPKLVAASTSFPIKTACPLSFASGPFNKGSIPSNSFDFASQPSTIFDMSIDKLGRESPTVIDTDIDSKRTAGTYIFKLPSTHLTGLQLGRMAVRFLHMLSSMYHFRYPVRKPRTLTVAITPVYSGSPEVPSHSTM